MTFMDMAVAFAQISPSFSFASFADILQPMIDATLAEQGKEQYRQGTLLTPVLLVWLVFSPCVETSTIIRHSIG